MINLGMTPSLDALKKVMDGINKKLGEAEVKAINDLAKSIQEGWTDDIKSAFDRPTKTTTSSVKLWPAKLSQEAKGHTIEATVLIRDKAPKGTAPATYLQSQALGGSRATKPFELLLVSQGRLPSGGFLQPARSVPRDQFGNVPKTKIVKALKSLQDDKPKRSRIEYVIAQPKGKSLGIWERDNQARTLSPYFIFKSGKQEVKERLRLADTANKIMDEKAPHYLRLRIGEGIK